MLPFSRCPVAEEGGITRAAAKLHRVQSNVTTRVKQLEARLGTPLFLRQNRRLILSPEGKRLLAYADQLLRLSAEAEAALRDGVPRGLLRVGPRSADGPFRSPRPVSGHVDRQRTGHRPCPPSAWPRSWFGGCAETDF